MKLYVHFLSECQATIQQSLLMMMLMERQAYGSFVDPLA